MVHLQAPCDNGSKIQSYILQWDEVNFLLILNEMLRTAPHSNFFLCKKDFKTEYFIL